MKSFGKNYRNAMNRQLDLAGILPVEYSPVSQTNTHLNHGVMEKFQKVISVCVCVRACVLYSAFVGLYRYHYYDELFSVTINKANTITLRKRSNEQNEKIKIL